MTRRHGRRATPSRSPSPAADPVSVLRRTLGRDDLRAWLGLDATASRRRILGALEQRRLELEVALARGERTDEAEAFLEAYDDLRRRLAPSQRPDDAPTAPDYYEVLGVAPHASYAEIERAFRARQSDAGFVDGGLVSQAWRVLGDPLNRARYDRTRREQATKQAPGDEDWPEPPSDVQGHVGEHSRVEMPGPGLHDVPIETDGAAVARVPLVVHGPGRFTADLLVDHPCMSTRPQGRLDVASGRHDLVVHFDGGKIRRQALTCTLTVANANEQHVIAFRLVVQRRSLLTHWKPWMMVASGGALLAVGFALGTRTTLVSTEPTPATLGRLDQIPGATACFEEAPGPLPAWVDVHTDGFGRPTGFGIGGATSPSAEACIRNTLVGLEFPATPDGQPVFHRYEIPSGPDAP